MDFPLFVPCPEHRASLCFPSARGFFPSNESVDPFGGSTLATVWFVRRGRKRGQKKEERKADLLMNHNLSLYFNHP